MVIRCRFPISRRESRTFPRQRVEFSGDRFADLDECKATIKGRATVHDRGGTDMVDTAGFVDVPGDDQGGLVFVHVATERGAADVLPGADSICGRTVRRCVREDDGVAAIVSKFAGAAAQCVGQLGLFEFVHGSRPGRHGGEADETDAVDRPPAGEQISIEFREAAVDLRGVTISSDGKDGGRNPAGGVNKPSRVAGRTKMCEVTAEQNEVHFDRLNRCGCKDLLEGLAIAVQVGDSENIHALTMGLKDSCQNRGLATASKRRQRIGSRLGSAGNDGV